MKSKLEYPFQLQSSLNKKLNIVVDFFLPRLCGVCKGKLSYEETVVCTKCFFELERTTEYILKSEYQNKFENSGLVSDFKAIFVFRQDSAVQNLLHSLKYDKKFLSGIFLGGLLAKTFKDEIRKWYADFIIPVPLHRLKKAERGYNQSEYIAKGLKRELKIEIFKNALKRIRFTETQTHLNYSERKLNVKNAFRVSNTNVIENKNIILVDDVVTTGSTINECAEALKKAGAKNVYGLFVATVPAL
jgi:ComF family protein